MGYGHPPPTTILFLAPIENLPWHANATTSHEGFFVHSSRWMTWPLYFGYESGLESGARDATLTDDGLQRANSDFGVIRNRDRYGVTIGTPLHNHMTTSLPNELEAVLFKNTADLPAGKDAELTHAPLQNG